MRNLIRFSFYRRIQLSFLILIILPVILSSAILLSLTGSVVTDKVRGANQSFLDLTAKDMAKMVEDLSFASNFFVQDPNAREQMRGFAKMDRITNFADYRRLEQIQEFFGLVLAKNLQSDVRMFLINDKEFVTSSTDYDGWHAQTMRHFRTVSPKVDPLNSLQIQWLGRVDPENGTGRSYYYAARVIRDPVTSKSLATLYIGLSSSYFDRIFKTVNHGGTFAIFDANHMRIAGNSSMSYENATETYDRISMKVPRTEWKLVFETPKRNITGEITRLFYSSLLFILPFFALFCVISVILARRLHRPIHRLQAMARQFGQGNRKIRFYDDGKDEIAVLGQTLNEMLDQINLLITNMAKEQEQKRILELQALFSQIRPHFLLNTLNSIKCSLVLAKDHHHSRKIESLMGLLRAYLKVNESFSLRDECELLRHYIEIMKLRNEMDIMLEIRLAPELEQFEVPKLLIQPLVENAIVHGFADKTSDAIIEISAEQIYHDIYIRIMDHGIGMLEQQRNELNEILEAKDMEQHSAFRRIGLLNVAQRLRLTYGPEAEMRVDANGYGGVTITLKLHADAKWRNAYVQSHAH